MEKVQWNSIDKKQNGLKYSKNDKSSTLPRLNTQYWILKFKRNNTAHEVETANLQAKLFHKTVNKISEGYLY